MPSLISLSELITAKNIAIVFVIVVFGWLWYNYSIVSTKDLKIQSIKMETYQNIISKYKDTVISRDGTINQLIVAGKKIQSELDACQFEKEVLEFECNMEDDFNETIVDPNASSLPF